MKAYESRDTWASEDFLFRDKDVVSINNFTHEVQEAEEAFWTLTLTAGTLSEGFRIPSIHTRLGCTASSRTKS